MVIIAGVAYVMGRNSVKQEMAAENEAELTQEFVDVNTPQYKEKTGDPSLNETSYEKPLCV